MSTRAPRLLERAFKIRFGLKLCLFTLVGAASLVVLLHLSLSRGLGSSYSSAIYAIYDLKIRVAPLIFASSYALLVLAVVTAAIAVISVLFSHRIAGPLYRLERSLEEIASGDLTVVARLRGKDQLTALADEMNAMVRSLNHTSRSVIDAVDEIRAAEERIRGLMSAGAEPGEVEDAARALRAASDRLTNALSHIRVRE